MNKEELKSELRYAQRELSNILDIITSVWDGDNEPKKALKIIENLCHLGLADGLAGEQRT